MAEVFNREIVSRTAAGVTVEAELLCVALITVFICLAGKYTVPPYPVTVVIWGDTFGFVATGTFGNFHIRIFFMILLLGHRLMHVKC